MPRSALPKTQKFRIVNMLGGMNTVAEENNLVALDPNARLGVGFAQVKTEFRDVKNFAPINRGGMSKTFGFTVEKNVGTTTPITGIYRFLKSNGTSQFIVSYQSNVYTLSGGTLTATGLTVTNNAYLHFETAYDTMIVCDGAGAAKTWNGSVAASLGGSPPSGARQSIFYNDRLFIFGSSNPSLLYYSTAGNIETGYASNFITCDANDGEKIVSVGKMFVPGELQPVLIVGKERSVGIVTGDGTAGDPFTFSKINYEVGVPGFRQMVSFEGDLAFLTPRGVSSYNTAIKGINIEQNFLSRNIYDQFTDLTNAALGNGLAFNDWKRRRMGFALPVDNATYPDRIYWFDYQSGCWYYQNGFRVTSAFVDTDGTLYTGTDTGIIYKHDTTVYHYASTAINAVLTTPYLDFFEPDGYKRIKWASVTARGNGSYSVGVSTKRDFGTSIGSTHSVDLSNTAYTWNGGTWTSNSATYQWGGAPILRKYFYPKGVFKNIQFTFTQSGTSQPVDLFELDFEVEYLTSY